MAIGVDRRRVPETTTGVHAGVAPEVVRGGVPLPDRVTGGDVEGVEDTLLATAVEDVGVTRDGRHVDGVVEDQRRHVDAFAHVGGEIGAPELGTGSGIECYDFGRVTETGSDDAVADRQAVRADGGGVEVGAPDLLAGGEVNGVNVVGHVLDVDHAVRDERVHRDHAVAAGGVERVVPRNGEIADVAGVDGAVAGVAVHREVLVLGEPVGRDIRFRRGRRAKRNRGCGDLRFLGLGFAGDAKTEHGGGHGS